MEKQFEDLSTEEMANLTEEQQEEYAKISDYSLAQVIAEVQNCKNILKRLN